MQTFKTYNDFLNLFRTELNQLSILGDDGRDIISSGLLAKQFDLAHSINSLLQGESVTGVPILIRSMYEASIDLRLNNQSKKHIGYLMLEEAERAKKAAENAGKAPKKSLLRALYTSEESISKAKNYYTQLQERASSLGIQGGKSIRTRFLELSIDSEYESLYAYLSKFVHTSPSMIESKYMNFKDGELVNIQLFPQVTESELRSLLLLAMRILLISLSSQFEVRRIKRMGALRSLVKLIKLI